MLHRVFDRTESSSVQRPTVEMPPKGQAGDASGTNRTLRPVTQGDREIKAWQMVSCADSRSMSVEDGNSADSCEVPGSVTEPATKRARNTKLKAEIEKELEEEKASAAKHLRARRKVERDNRKLKEQMETLQKEGYRLIKEVNHQQRQADDDDIIHQKLFDLRREGQSWAEDYALPGKLNELPADTLQLCEHPARGDSQVRITPLTEALKQFRHGGYVLVHRILALFITSNIIVRPLARVLAETHWGDIMAKSQTGEYSVDWGIELMVTSP